MTDISARPFLVEIAKLDRKIAAARAQLDEAAFAAAWAQGCVMTTEQAIAFGLEEKKSYTQN
jgi:hypothetical protein